MALAILAFLGGALTILSPCILPVLPFVFARSEQPFTRSTLPLLLGMALTFAAIATLAAVGGSWAVRLFNSFGRGAALLLLAAFGVALLSRTVADRLSRPFVAVGNRMLQSRGPDANVTQSFVLGVATGFLWAPCAGPILGLVLTGAALSGPNAGTTVLLLAYSLGAMASLSLATLAGGRIFAALKRSLHAGEWVRRGLGVAVLVAVVVVALGLDTGVLTQVSYASTNGIEQRLVDRFQTEDESAHAMAVEGELPRLDGATAWLNSPALTAEGLRGKVVVIDFWTYSCINCLRALPYTKAWYERYKDDGLVVIGVHAPEFAFERDEANVRKAVAQLDVRYPVALDNSFAIWKAFNNRYWPAHYFIDAQGRVRGHHFGEGNYDESERLIRALLNEAGHANLPAASSDVEASGVEVAGDLPNVQSPETYIGYKRAQNFSSTGGIARDEVKTYAGPAELGLNQWALDGTWNVGSETAVLANAPGKITFQFQARDLHLVLAPAPDGRPVRFRVTIDGEAPGQDRGSDVDASGTGVVKEQRLYQLIRQSDGARKRTFSIEFLDPEVRAYAFTFG